MVVWRHKLGEVEN